MSSDVLNFGLSFGALSDPIAKQLRAGGLKAKNPKSIDYWQADADAISRLSIRGILSASETDKARKRLIKSIDKGITVA